MGLKILACLILSTILFSMQPLDSFRAQMNLIDRSPYIARTPALLDGDLCESVGCSGKISPNSKVAHRTQVWLLPLPILRVIEEFFDQFGSSSIRMNLSSRGAIWCDRLSAGVFRARSLILWANRHFEEGFCNVDYDLARAKRIP
jgi:hypothetical protein